MVVFGGGCNYWYLLFDVVMVKDNYFVVFICLGFDFVFVLCDVLLWLLYIMYVVVEVDCFD